MRTLHRRRPTSIAAISALLIAIALPSLSRAQSPEAAQLFDDGDKLLKQGKLAEACDAFESSNRIEPRAGTLIRLGDCRERNHQLASAWSAFKDALTRVKDPKKQAVAKARVAALEPRLSYLTVAVASPVDGLTVTRDDKPVDAGLWNKAIPIDGGSYAIVVTAPGFVMWRAAATVPNEHGDVTIAVPKLAPMPVEQPARAVPVKALVFDQPSAFTTQRDVAIGLAGVAVAAAVVGIVLGSSANDKQHDAYALCPDATVPCAQADQANALVSSGHTRAFEADAGFGVAAVGLIAAVSLWFTGAPPERLNLSVDYEHRSVLVMGRF
ncbi:MAG TPA: hypothetical protein VH143_28280 [Kofleriaceae bacterium]|jgi:hypothetical protein|nr:hypothetical protein [Kofleriaceae bacterium]